VKAVSNVPIALRVARDSRHLDQRLQRQHKFRARVRTLPTLLSIGQFYGTSPFLLPPMLWGLFKKKSRLPKALSAY
jgi:hypothetical protein